MVNDIWNMDSSKKNWDIKMNSIELQKIFQTTYKTFFNTHDAVLSGNAVLTWWADISHGVSALRIKQKLPVKTYCGINFNTSGKITFWKTFTYSIIEHIFEEDELSSFFQHDTNQITQFLQNFLTKNGYIGWLEIDILFETPPWHGFSFSGVISVLLTFLSHILVKKLDMNTLLDREFPMGDTLFDQLYIFSLRLSNCISGGKSVGWASNCVVMMPGISLPIAHFSEKCIHTNSHENILDEENDDIHRCINTILYKDSLLSFLWKNTLETTELPIDYGVIFTGMEYRFADIEATREERKYEEEKLRSFLTGIAKSLPIPKPEQEVLSGIMNFEKDEIIYKHIDHMNLKVLEWFNFLFRAIQPDAAMDSFIDAIRKIWLSSFSYQNENKLFFALQHLFHQYQQFDDEHIGILPFNTGRIGGSLFFVMKKWKSRNTIQKVIDQLKRDGHIVSLDHASWRDGYSSDWVRVEQYISHKIFSEYTREGDVLYTDSYGRSYSGDYDTMIKDEVDGILLDTIWGRIYIQGTKLTSKEIHSQNTTIDMLRILLENMSKEVSNSELPISTYSQNKNEILSKIVLPIKKITKERFGQEISLTCSGWITEYYLKLNRDEDIRVGIIRKLRN